MIFTSYFFVLAYLFDTFINVIAIPYIAYTKELYKKDRNKLVCTDCNRITLNTYIFNITV